MGTLMCTRLAGRRCGPEETVTTPGRAVQDVDVILNLSKLSAKPGNQF